MANGARRPGGVQVLPQQRTFGEELGAGLGTGLSAGLQTLLQQKAQQVQQRGQASGLEALANLTGQQISSEQSQAIAQLDPSLQQQLVKQMVQAPQQRQFANLMGQLMGTTGDDAPNVPGMQNIEGNVEIDRGADNSPQLDFTGLNEQQVMNLVKTAQGQEKNNIARSKELKKDVDEALKVKNTAQQRLKTLDEMQKLNDSGKLDEPGTAQFLNKLGMDWALSPESQLYQSLENDFMGDMKSVFGGKVSDKEMQRFLRSIPQLVNSKEGREAIQKFMKNKYQAQALRADATKEVYRKNPKIDPVDFSIQVDDLFEKKQDQLSAKINKQFEKAREITPELQAGSKVSFEQVPVGRQFVQNGKVYEKAPGGEKVFIRDA